MTKALFLDRDGVINHDVGYAFKPSQIQFIDGIFELCAFFQAQGFMIIIVTNQSGIARGFYSEDDFAALSAWFIERFKERGITISHIYHCPHHPDITGPCACRKPNPGMLLEAIKNFAVTAQQSIMIGDKVSDMQAAQSANIGHRYFYSSQHCPEATFCSDQFAALTNDYKTLWQPLPKTIFYKVLPANKPF